jgi:hypothetical protein
VNERKIGAVHVLAGGANKTLHACVHSVSNNFSFSLILQHITVSCYSVESQIHWMVPNFARIRTCGRSSPFWLDQGFISPAKGRGIWQDCIGLHVTSRNDSIKQAVRFGSV